MTKHILAIDDDAVICDMYQTILNEMGRSVAIAYSGEDGVEKAKNRQPDMVFLDLYMPGIGGIETLRRFNKLIPDVPVYVVTAFHKKYLQQLQKVSDEGISFQVCNKPLNISQIREITENILGTVEADKQALVLRLYIAGQLPSSNSAVENVKKIFGEELRRKYELEVIDVLKEHGKAEEDNIIATPSLILLNPPTHRMIIGDLSNKEKVMAGLGLR